MGSIPGLGRSPGGEYGNPLQDFCLGNSMYSIWGPTVHIVVRVRHDWACDQDYLQEKEVQKRENGCLRRPYKQQWKEEKWKSKEKRKDIPIASVPKASKEK